MKKREEQKKQRKLELRRETIRGLATAELNKVIGGLNDLDLSSESWNSECQWCYAF